MITRLKESNYRIPFWLMVLTVCFAGACARTTTVQQSQTQQPVAPVPAHGQGQLVFQPPTGWISEPPTSAMRVAQYRLPRAEGDAEDASLVTSYLGGQGGSVEANLERWTDQMEQPDGSPSKDKATTKTVTVNSLKVTLLDVTGTYRADTMMPGGGARLDKPNFRMRAAVIETPRGPYFVKLVGPVKTVGRWDEAFMKFIESAQVK